MYIYRVNPLGLTLSLLFFYRVMGTQPIIDVFRAATGCAPAIYIYVCKYICVYMNKYRVAAYLG